MAIEYATISGQLLDPAGQPLLHLPLFIEAATADGLLKDTGSNTIWWRRTQINAAGDGSYTVTLPKLPQADIDPGTARWRLILPSSGAIYSLDEGFTPSSPDPIEFELTGDTTWDALVDVSGTPVSDGLITQLTALRDETVAAAGAVDYTQTRLGLRRYYEHLAKRGSRRVNIVLLGDSIFEGAGLSPASTKRSIVLLQAAIRARLGLSVGGFGYFPADYGNLITDETTRTGLVQDWNYTFGPAGKALKLIGHASTPGSVTWPAQTCTKVRVYYGKTSIAGGNFKVFIDSADVTNTGTLGGNGTSGASGATVSCVDAVSNSGGYYWESATLTDASHTIEVRANVPGFVCPIVAVHFFNGDTASSVHVIDAAHTGAQVDDFLSAAMDPAWDEHETHNADLTIVNLGTNDVLASVSAATYQANLTSLVGKIKTAAPNGAILIVHGWRAGTAAQASWDDYGTAARAVADAEPLATYLDLEQLWMPLTTDGSENNGLMWEATNPIHPNGDGHRRLADIFTTLLMPT